MQETGPLRERLQRERGITPQRLAQMVAQKQEEFAGLLNEQAAVYAIAKEHGLDVEVAPQPLQLTKILQLNEKSRNVNLLCTVKRAYALRTFERNGKKGSVVNMVVEDDSGMMRLVLWNRDAESVEKGNIEKGDTVDIRNAYVKPSLVGGIELHLGLSGSIRRSAAHEKKEAKLLKLKDLSDGAQDVEVVARVLELGKRTEFERNGKMGSVSSCLVGDDTATMRLALWDANSLALERLKVNDIVKVENGYVRNSQNGAPELHVNWAGRLVIGPRDAKVAGREEILKVPLVKISDLKDGDKCEVRATLAEILSHTPPNPQERFYLLCRFEDGSGKIDAELSGRAASRLAGIKNLADDIEFATVLKLKHDSLIGKEFFLLGKKSGGKFEVESVVS